jgi:ABC-type nitrate/sulfonate/bicarbonate transport system permease component
MDDRAMHDSAEAMARRSLRRRRDQTIIRYTLGVICPLVLLAIWQLLDLSGIIDQRFFPPPTRVLLNGVGILTDAQQRGQLLSDTLITLERLAVGYVIGAVCGVAMGMAMALYAPLRYAFSPVVYATFPMPKIAIFPLLIALFGIGEGSKMALVVMGVFYMTCINTLSGVLYANPIHRDVIRAFRIPKMTSWLHVVLPSAMPAIVTGLKLGLGQALILVVSAEFVSADDGIGHYIWDSWQVLAIPRMFVGLVVVTAIGGIAVLLGSLLERRLVPWASH